jgi:hypothetical protein
MQRKGALNPYPLEYLPEGEAGSSATWALSNDHAFEGLATFSLTFDDLQLYFDGIAGTELGDIFVYFSLNDRTDVHYFSPRCGLSFELISINAGNRLLFSFLL